MAGHSTDEERDERIAMEIIVDAYDEKEQAQAWHAYLSGHLHFPFTARCIVERAISPLKVSDEINVVGIAPYDECPHAIFVLTEWKGLRFGVPLIQLEGVQADKKTRQAIEDWHYWVKQERDEEDDEWEEQDYEE